LANTLLKKEIPANPYSRLAAIYDDVMAHVDYKLWASYIHRVIKKWHSSAFRIVDISCGTGSLLLQLTRYGYHTCGFDFSFEMVRRAQMKFQSTTPAKPVWQGDMISFHLKKKPDVLICIYDSINYLQEIEAVARVLQMVWENLSIQGLFIFDICTARNSLDYFQNYVEQNNGAGYSYTRHSTYIKKHRVQQNRFEITFDSDPNIYTEVHKQRIFSVDEIVSLIGDSNFSLVGFFDGFSFRQGSERSYRIHFVLKKE
jgi:predicted TPR repeat methyltransferase